MDIESVKFEAFKIIEAETNSLDKLNVPADLVGLYGDIRVELSRKAPDSQPLIDEYTELMAREQKLYSPEAAFQAGCDAARLECGSSHKNYIKSIYSSPDNQCFLNDRDVLYHKLRDLLGEAYGLMDDYTELYRRCHGIINSQIERFYYMGYYNDKPDATISAG